MLSMLVSAIIMHPTGRMSAARFFSFLYCQPITCLHFTPFLKFLARTLSVNILQDSADLCWRGQIPCYLNLQVVLNSNPKFRIVCYYEKLKRNSLVTKVIFGIFLQLIHSYSIFVTLSACITGFGWIWQDLGNYDQFSPRYILFCSLIFGQIWSD